MRPMRDASGSGQMKSGQLKSGKSGRPGTPRERGQLKSGQLKSGRPGRPRKREEGADEKWTAEEWAVWNAPQQDRIAKLEGHVHPLLLQVNYLTHNTVKIFQ